MELDYLQFQNKQAFSLYKAEAPKGASPLFFIAMLLSCYWHALTKRARAGAKLLLFIKIANIILLKNIRIRRLLPQNSKQYKEHSFYTYSYL